MDTNGNTQKTNPGSLFGPAAEKRDQTISFRVTETELRAIETAARGVNADRATWARDAILARLESTPAEELILAELLALRSFVRTAIARAHPALDADLRALAEKVDAEKAERARRALGGSR